MPIKGIAYQVLLNKTELGRGTSGAAVTIPPYGERIVEVNVISNAFSLLKRVQEIASGATTDGITLSINGKANVANRPEPIPFSFKSEIAGRS
jgi:LEA14-like dessication related protein